MNFSRRHLNPSLLHQGWRFALAVLSVAVTLSCSFLTQIPVTGGAPLGRIAYIGADSNIYTIDRQGKNSTAITQDAQANPDSGQPGRVYQYPTWAPDGRKLAFVGLSASSAAESQASLWVASSNGKDRVEAFNSQKDFPFYLFWSPNSQYVTFLSSSPGEAGMALQMAAAKGGDSKVLGTGQPFYWDWSPDNKSIFMHTGGASAENPGARMELLKLDDTGEPEEFALKPGSFQAPAWSPDGHELVMSALNDAGKEELVLADPNGTIESVLAEVAGPVAFAWSPNGKRLAYTLNTDGDPMSFQNRLVLIDPSHPDQSTDVAEGLVLAFFWSPDSREIAYFTLKLPDPGAATSLIAQTQPKIEFEVRIYSVQDGRTVTTAVFQPTRSFLQLIPFFDQYQRSGTIWSPDSQDLVLSGIANNGEPAIFVLSAAGGQLDKIADGSFALWSWK